MNSVKIVRELAGAFKKQIKPISKELDYIKDKISQRSDIVKIQSVRNIIKSQK